MPPLLEICTGFSALLIMLPCLERREAMSTVRYQMIALALKWVIVVSMDVLSIGFAFCAKLKVLC